MEEFGSLAIRLSPSSRETNLIVCRTGELEELNYRQVVEKQTQSYLRLAA